MQLWEDPSIKENPKYLVDAAKNGSISVLELLVKSNGFDVNGKDESDGGNTSLHVAAQNNNREVVEKLIELGCDVTIENSSGEAAVDLTDDKDIRGMLLYFVVNCKEYDGYGLVKFDLKGKHDVGSFLTLKFGLCDITTSDGSNLATANIYVRKLKNFDNDLSTLGNLEDLDFATQTIETSHLSVERSNLNQMISVNVGVLDEENVRNRCVYFAFECADENSQVLLCLKKYWNGLFTPSLVVSSSLDIHYEKSNELGKSKLFVFCKKNYENTIKHAD